MDQGQRSGGPQKYRCQYPRARLRGGAYVPTGQFFNKTAYRKNIKGYVIAPAIFMWNVEKT